MFTKMQKKCVNKSEFFNKKKRRKYNQQINNCNKKTIFPNKKL